MKLLWFHLMPYPAFPEDFNRKHRSVWVDVDPALFDPAVVADCYERYIEQLVHAEQCGFDGICVNEHHANGYGLMPSPNVVASILATRTSRAAITVLGNSVALYNPPVRVAEEMAMLDLLSRGRLISGFPVGTSMDTAYAYSANPGTLREKYLEGIELILRAWAATEPFAFNGRFTQMRYVNVLPRPLQQPHPPVWIPGGGSVETWDFCSQNDFVYAALSYYGHLMARETVSGYWRRVEANGKDPNPYRLAFLQFIGVADTDQEAYRLYREPAEYFFNRSLHVYPGYADPPGYITEASARARYQSQVRAVVRAKQAKHDLTWDEMVEKGYVVIGSPDTVRETLVDVATTFNCGHLLTMLQFGNMSDELTRYNSELFGAKVAPGLRDLFSDAEDHWWPENAACAECRASPRLPARHRRASGALAGDRRSSRTPGGTSSSRSCPGSTGVPGFRPPDDHLGWLVVAWDALDATGALPCPVVGASVGGMLAADLAVFRPEAVTALALLAPFGIFDEQQPGPRPVRRAGSRADEPPLRQGRPRAVRRALRPPRRGRRAGRPVPLRRRRGEPALAARRPRPGAPPAPLRCPAHGAVGRPGRAAPRGRRRRRGWPAACRSRSSPVPAICSNGTRPTRWARASWSFLDRQGGLDGSRR